LQDERRSSKRLREAAAITILATKPEASKEGKIGGNNGKDSDSDNDNDSDSDSDSGSHSDRNSDSDSTKESTKVLSQQDHDDKKSFLCTHPGCSESLAPSSNV
jgi:hypothetical protein